MTTNYSEMTNRRINYIVIDRLMGLHIGSRISEGLNIGYWCDKSGQPLMKLRNLQPIVNIRQAFKVVEKMIADGWRFELNYGDNGNGWAARFYRVVGYEHIDKFQCRAICIAALMAKEAEHE